MSVARPHRNRVPSVVRGAAVGHSDPLHTSVHRRRPSYAVRRGIVVRWLAQQCLPARARWDIDGIALGRASLVRIGGWPPAALRSNLVAGVRVTRLMLCRKGAPQYSACVLQVRCGLVPPHVWVLRMGCDCQRRVGMRHAGASGGPANGGDCCADATMGGSSVAVTGVSYALARGRVCGAGVCPFLCWLCALLAVGGCVGYVVPVWLVRRCPLMA